MKVGYEDLAVQNGTAASQAFLRTTFDQITPDEKTRIRKNLENYCGRDTEGMTSAYPKLFMVGKAGAALAGEEAEEGSSR